MPCSKYEGKQRAACYATNEWERPVRKKRKKKRKTQRQRQRQTQR